MWGMDTYARWIGYTTMVLGSLALACLLGGWVMGQASISAEIMKIILEHYQRKSDKRRKAG